MSLCYNLTMRQRRVAANVQAFTLVELTIAIVVIAILASITLLAYQGTTIRANDDKIRSAVVQLQKAISVWSSQTNITDIIGGAGSTTAPSASGCVDGLNGWFASGRYTCTVEDELVAEKVIPANFTVNLPKNTYYSPGTGDGRFSLMMYRCGGSGSGAYALYWTLQNPDANESAAIDSTLATCGHATTIRDTNGMRSGAIIRLG